VSFASRPAAVTVLLLAVVLASRLAARPHTVWEQDEAYLAMAAVHFDPLEGRPQPPWSPLWVGLGHAGRLLGFDPTASLQLLGLAASVLSLLPLAAMWTGTLGRGKAVLAALLFLATPVAWLNAGRALTETPATAALALMCACWCRRERGGALAGGSLAGAAAILVRPQLALAVVLPALATMATAGGGRERVRVVAPGLALVLAGAAATVLAAGGLYPLRASLARHAALHFGQLDTVSYALGASGLARGLLHPGAAAAWIVLAAIGAAAVLRAGGVARRDAGVLLAALAGATLAVYGVASPQHARYFIPVLALSSGFVVAGAALLLRRAAAPVVTVAVGAYAALVIPGLAEYRSRPSPPIAALREAAVRQRSGGAAVVVDRRLNAFADWVRTFESPDLRVVYDYEAQLGLGALEHAPLVVAVYDANHQLAWLPGAAIERFSWSAGAVRSLSPDRYVDVTVATAVMTALPPTSAPSAAGGGEIAASAGR
jgi:4-amino-4-deoxy-L-arabinose transferase-like glycosyltransferase